MQMKLEFRSLTKRFGDTVALGVVPFGVAA